MVRFLALGACGMLASVSVALAHITLENKEAPVASGYKAVFKVPHGCDGSPTTALKVRIPEGLIDVKPMPKPGWKLDVVKGKYPKPIDMHGTKITEGVTEVDWSSGKLPDGFYDEFVFIGTLGDTLEAGKMLYFPVVQECEKGVSRWIEIPAAGAADHGGHGGEASTPAPGLKLLPKR
jgi:periplasmic copper chaperone A